MTERPSQLTAAETVALERKVIRSSAWVAVSHGMRTGLSLLSTLVLVRLIAPEAFGLVALASTFVVVLELLQASGMTAALIYRRDRIEQAAGSALVFSSFAGVALFGVSFAAAPLFARLVDMPESTDVVRVMAVLLIVRGLGIAPGAILERALDFRSRARAEVAAVVTQVGLAIGLAFAGFGVWSLVAGQLAGAAVQTIAFWALVPWRPSPRAADWTTLREMLRYGRSVSAGNLIGIANSTVQNVVIARLLGATALGYYTVAFRLADLPTSAVGFIVGRVMLPAYSIVQDDAEAFRRTFLNNLQRVAMFSLPLAVVLGVAAEPIVLALLGQPWSPIVTPLRVIAAYSVVRSFASCTGAVFQALGKPHLVPLLALPHSLAIVPALLLLTPRYGVTGTAVAMLASFSLAGVPSLVVAFRMLGIGPRLIARELGPLLACSGALLVVLAFVIPAIQPLPGVAELVTLGAVGAAVYAMAAATVARRAVAPVWAGLRSAA